MSDNPKPVFRPDGGGYIVYLGGDRIGWVRQVGGAWHATDTYMVPVRGTKRTRALAVGALLRQCCRYRRQDSG